MVVQRLRFYGALCVASLFFGTFAIAMSDAADGPNQVTESDFAAGQLMDSFFDNEMPDSSRVVKQQRRRTSRRRVALRGRLVDNPKPREGAPPFALVNREGQVLRYVEASDEVDLQMYLGETIGVRQDTGKILLASQLALPKLTDDENAQLSAFNEEPTPADEPESGAGAEESVLTPAPDEGPTTAEGSGGEQIEGDYYTDIDFDGCSQCGSGVCGGCAPGRGVMYVHGEYLLWWMEGMKTPPLVIQGADASFNPAQVLYGGNNILEDVRHGGRITLGLWLDEGGMWGLEGDYLGLGELEEVFRAGGNDRLPGATDEIYIGRPFFSPVQVTDDLDNVVVPRGPSQEEVDTDNLDGYVTVTSRSKFESVGIRLRHGLCYTPRCGDVCCGDQVACGAGVNCGSRCGCPFNGPLGRLCRLIRHGNRRTDVIYGLRWASLDESLGIEEDLLVVDGNAAPRFTTFNVQDHFGTSNDFFGGEIGFMMQWERNRWSLDFLSKVAIGNTRQQVAITGSTTVGGASPAGFEEGGLLAQRYVHPGNASYPAPFTVGNIGVYERDEFSMIPEIGATLGYYVTPRLKLTFGYTLLYWSNVVRPGEQIDLDVNAHLLDKAAIDTDDVNQIVPGDHPRFEFRQSDLWAHGINLGGEYRW